VHWDRSEPSASEPDSLEARGSEPEKTEAEPGAHLHDGMYYRVALGTGYVKATTENGSELTGWGFSSEFWMGGSPIAGLALGGTFGIVAVPNPDAAISAADSGAGPDSGEAQGIATYSTFGMFADYYPNPRGGLHIMAGLNFSSFKFTADSGTASQPATGVGLFGGIGYEWWAGQQWSVGPLVRLHWASVSDDSGGTSVLSPVFMLGVTNY
jgi:hypothetical protein